MKERLEAKKKKKKLGRPLNRGELEEQVEEGGEGLNGV